MNLNFVAVAVLVLAVNCSALTREELLANFGLVESNFLVREAVVRVNIESYVSILTDYVNTTETTLNSELVTASQPFWDAIDVLTIQAAENGKNITFCTNDIFSQFIVLQSAALAKPKNKITTIYAIGAEKLDAVNDILTNAETKFSEFAQKSSLCSTDSCATELNTDLIQIYDSVLIDINTAIADAVEYIFSMVPDDLAGDIVDTDQLKSDYQDLIDTVAECVNS